MMKKQFTLIELIMSVVVIASLAAIVMVNVKSIKNEALASMVSSNTTSLQTAIDRYRLDNNMSYPSVVPPTLKNPQEIDMDLLYPKYLTKRPDLAKDKNQHYWVDVFGKVWGATVDAPKGFIQTTDAIEWDVQSDVVAYQVYAVPDGDVSGSARKGAFRKIASFQADVNADKVHFSTKENNILISAIDKHGLETVPIGSSYTGSQEEWFSPILSRNGEFNFELKSHDTMIWEGFRSVQDTPPGTAISFEFSILDEQGKFTPYTEDFETLSPSSHLKMKVTLTGSEGKSPTLYDMRIFYRFNDDSIKESETKKISSTNLTPDGTPVDIGLPVSVVDEFILLPGYKVDAIVHSDSFTVGNEPRVAYTYSTDSENFIPVSSFQDVPEGSAVRIERMYQPGDVTIRDLTVKQHNRLKVQDGNSSLPYDGGTTSNPPSDTDPMMNDPKWKTVDRLDFIAHSGDGQKVRWLRAEVESTIPDPVSSRIVYLYAGGSDQSWNTSTTDISQLGLSQSVKMTAYIQVSSDKLGTVTNPSIQAVRLVSEQGVSNLSLVKPTVMIFPTKSNNQRTSFFSPETTVEWTYDAYDPRGRKIVDIEWGGDKRSQYPVGSYSVRARVKNESGDWSDWTTFSFTVKEEQPVAIIRSSTEEFRVGTSISWIHSSSFDPDEDGITKVEWDGDKQSVYEEIGTYTVRLRVQDAEGHWSPWATKTFSVLGKDIVIYRVEGEDDLKFTPTTSYATAINSPVFMEGASRDTVRHLRGASQTYFAAVRHTFVGEGFVLKLKDPVGVRVILDGTLLETVTASGEHIISRKNLPLESHSIEIKAVGSNASTYVDYLDVHSSDDRLSITNMYTRQVDSNNNESVTNNNLVATTVNSSSKTYFTLTKDAKVTAQVLDNQGQVVRTFFTDKDLTGGSFDVHHILWDGENDAGLLVSTGLYQLRISAKGLGGSLATPVQEPLYVDSRFASHRAEAEGDELFKQSSGSAIQATYPVAGASGGKMQYIQGASVSYSATLTYAFNGTGFDIKVRNPKNLMIALNGVILENVTFTGDYLISRRNLSTSSNTLTIRTLRSTSSSYVDYVDVYVD